MATSEIYSQVIISEIIKNFLQDGKVPTVSEIEAEFNLYVAANDITKPSFDANSYIVQQLEESSAGKYNEGHGKVKQDLDILFKTLYRSTEDAVNLFDRWQSKASRIENRIVGLEGRIDRLLTLAEDTSGFFDTVGDNFADTKLIDLDLSKNISVNLPQNLVGMAKSTGQNATSTRIFLNNLSRPQVKFTPLTQNSIIGVVDQQNTEPRFAFRDENQYWKTNILTTKKIIPLICDLSVSLSESISISRIGIVLHSSESNSTTKITPMYSSDGVNFRKIPSLTTTLESLDRMEFVFPEINLVKLKLIIEKNGHDFIDGNNNFVYELGAKEIGLYKEAFSDDPAFKAIVISKGLSASQPSGDLTLFNKLTLDVCEAVPENTNLDYFLAVGKDSSGTPLWLTTEGFVAENDISYDPSKRLWTAITPANRENGIHPKILDFASISSLKETDISISYDVDGGERHQSPGRNFKILLQDSGTGTVSSETAENKNPTPFHFSDRRYYLPQKHQKILDLQIDKAVDIDSENIRLWRNVGSRGIAVNDSTKMVRKTQIGWEYKAPYYSTNILIENTEGLTIDVGNNPIVIDQVNHSGVIGPDILSPGTHSVKVHKDYWRWISPGLNNEEELKATDILYPYNQKLLIEGYEYGGSYPTDDEKIYVGADRFAGILATKVGVFDVLNNIPFNDYTKYGIDSDGPNQSTFTSGDDTGLETPISSVIVLNVDETNADFVNEKFVLEFNLRDELFSYVALRAEMKTSSPQSGPVLDEYRIKLAT